MALDESSKDTDAQTKEDVPNPPATEEAAKAAKILHGRVITPSLGKPDAVVQEATMAPATPGGPGQGAGTAAPQEGARMGPLATAASAPSFAPPTTKGPPVTGARGKPGVVGPFRARHSSAMPKTRFSAAFPS